MDRDSMLSAGKAPELVWIERPFYLISKVMKVMVFVLLLIMVVTVFANVVGRYVLSTALNWADEVSRAAFVWLVFVSIVLTMWDRGHIGLGNCVARINPVAGRIADVLAALLKLLFALYVVLGGWQLVSLTLVQLTEYLAIPSAYIYSIVPVMSILMFVVGIRDLLLLFKRERIR